MFCRIPDNNNNLMLKIGKTYFRITLPLKYMTILERLFHGGAKAMTTMWSLREDFAYQDNLAKILVRINMRINE